MCRYAHSLPVKLSIYYSECQHRPSFHYLEGPVFVAANQYPKTRERAYTNQMVHTTDETCTHARTHMHTHTHTHEASLLTWCWTPRLSASCVLRVHLVFSAAAVQAYPWLVFTTVLAVLGGSEHAPLCPPKLMRPPDRVGWRPSLTPSDAPVCTWKLLESSLSQVKHSLCVQLRCI